MPCYPSTRYAPEHLFMVITDKKQTFVVAAASVQAARDMFMDEFCSRTIKCIVPLDANTFTLAFGKMALIK